MHGQLERAQRGHCLRHTKVETVVPHRRQMEHQSVTATTIRSRLVGCARTDQTADATDCKLSQHTVISGSPLVEQRIQTGALRRFLYFWYLLLGTIGSIPQSIAHGASCLPRFNYLS